jgi:hypothetical protein
MEKAIKEKAACRVGKTIKDIKQYGDGKIKRIEINLNHPFHNIYPSAK